MIDPNKVDDNCDYEFNWYEYTMDIGEYIALNPEDDNKPYIVDDNGCFVRPLSKVGNYRSDG